MDTVSLSTIGVSDPRFTIVYPGFPNPAMVPRAMSSTKVKSLDCDPSPLMVTGRPSVTGQNGTGSCQAFRPGHTP